MFSYDLLQ